MTIGQSARIQLYTAESLAKSTGDLVKRQLRKLKIGSWLCACGRTISANKNQCLACSEKSIP